MTTRRMLAAGLLALAAAGCTTFSVQTDYDHRTNFLAWHTYAWLPQEPVKATEGATAFGNPINQRRVRDAIDAELAARGLQRVEDVAAADGVIRWAIGTRERPYYWADPYWGMGWGWGWYGYHGYYGGMMYNYPYYETEARLAVDMFDAKTHEPAWHGTVSLDSTMLTGDAAADQIRRAVQALMQHYPPGSPPPQK